MTEDTAERWLPVVGYEGLYDVSDLGRVRSLPRQTVRGVRGGKVLKPVYRGQRGYPSVSLSRDGLETMRYIHDLVLESFGSPRPAGAQARHGPGGILDASYNNLSWGSASENNGLDKIRDGTDPGGERNPNAKLSLTIINDIRRRVAAGELQRDVAAQYEISAGHTSHIVNGSRWGKH